MNAQHFKEIVGTIMKTKKVTKKWIYQRLNISDRTIYNYETKGVPFLKKPRIMAGLRKILLEIPE